MIPPLSFPQVAVVLTRTLPRYSFLSSVLVILALTHLVALILLLVWFLPASPPPALPVFTAVSGVVLSLAAAGLVRARRSVQSSIKAFVWASWLGELAMSIERVYLFGESLSPCLCSIWSEYDEGTEENSLALVEVLRSVPRESN